MDDGQLMRITRRAYELWQQAGEPKGRDEDFYRQASRELNEGANKANEGNSSGEEVRQFCDFRSSRVGRRRVRCICDGSHRAL